MSDGRRVRVTGAASGIGAQDVACADGPVAFHHSQAWQALARHPALDWGRTLFAPNGERLSRTARIAARSVRIDLTIVTDCSTNRPVPRRECSPTEESPWTRR